MKNFHVRFAIIHGEYSYREWIDVRASEMDAKRAIDCIADDVVPDHLSNERQGFSNELLSKDSAMIPGQDRAIVNINWEEVRPITVTVRGGVVQDIDRIPEGVRVKVVDWDNDETDGNGDSIPSVGIWDCRDNSPADDGLVG